MSQLAEARYGKDNVRVYKVHRDEKTGVQTVVEMTVRTLLEGEIETSYTKADNSVVVATDSQKNIVYILAKQNPVTPPELFASIVGQFFIDTYKHIHAANVQIIVHKWTRMTIDGKPHPHSFLRDGNETRNVEARVERNGPISIRSAIKGLLVLKSTGSQFHGFIRDEYTTLGETRDRILSTEVDCGWDWKKFSGMQDVRKAVPVFDRAYETANRITLKTFAEEDSASVQATMYNMANSILAAEPGIATVDYTLPNKHYFEINLSWHKGLKNTGKDAEVYAPQSGPNGLIYCKVGRKGAKL